jgi:hypothetical protein
MEDENRHPETFSEKEHIEKGWEGDDEENKWRELEREFSACEFRVWVGEWGKFEEEILN